MHFGSQLVEVEYPNLVLGIDMCPLGTSMKPTMHTVTLSTVDLLKIDVERAEVDALRGVEPSDWPQIQQVVMEVRWLTCLPGSIAAAGKSTLTCL